MSLLLLCVCLGLLSTKSPRHIPSTQSRVSHAEGSNCLEARPKAPSPHPTIPTNSHPSGTPFPIRLKREDRSNSRHKNIQRRTNVNWHGCASLSQHVSIACSIKTLQRCQKLTSATVAITALNIPMIRFHPIAMPLPVPRCALGSTSGVYAYNVP
jgi:hypothetical protein